MPARAKNFDCKKARGESYIVFLRYMQDLSHQVAGQTKDASKTLNRMTEDIQKKLDSGEFGPEQAEALRELLERINRFLFEATAMLHDLQENVYKNWHDEVMAEADRNLAGLDVAEAVLSSGS